MSGLRSPHAPSPRSLLATVLAAAGVCGAADTVFSAPPRKLPEVVTTDIAGVMSAVRRPGATAVLVNVWATWCEPCVEEMPDILKFYRDNRDRGLRLVLVSADSASSKKQVARFLAKLGVEFRSYLKTGDDMVFIDGLDPALGWYAPDLPPVRRQRAEAAPLARRRHLRCPEKRALPSSEREAGAFTERQSGQKEEPMKTLTLTLSALALFAAGAARADDKPLALAAKAPAADTKLKNVVDGKEVSIAKAAGKSGTLVVFTCNECPYAKAWEQRIVDLGNTYSKKGIGVLLINSNNPNMSKKDSFELTQARAKERGIQFAYAVDPNSSVAKAFGATRTPEAFLFDKGGKLVYHGTIDDNHEEADKVQKRYLKDALDAVSSGKAPAVQETKSLGCTIKFARDS